MEGILIAIIFRFSLEIVNRFPHRLQSQSLGNALAAKVHSLGTHGVMGRGCVLDVKQIKGLQPETGREVRGEILAGDCVQQKRLMSYFLCSSCGSHFPSYTWSLPCPLPRLWRNAGRLARGDILPGRWLPGLWGCSCGHPSQAGSREASLQPHSQETASSGGVG